MKTETTKKKQHTHNNKKHTLKIIRMKAKQRVAQGVTNLCETSSVHLETGPLYIQNPQRNWVSQKELVISATLSLHQVDKK